MQKQSLSYKQQPSKYQPKILIQTLNHKQQQSYIPFKYHLNQIYNQMPKYANDPTQSKFIQIYDHIMNRYQGHYGKQPQYFIKVPATLTLFGDVHNYITSHNNKNRISISSLQEIVIAVGKNSANEIRINNYQKAVYGQLNLSTNAIDWKFQQRSQNQKEKQFNQEQILKQQQYQGENDIKKLLNSNPIVQQYTNIIIATLKNSLGNDRNYQTNKGGVGMDLLIYCNYLPEQNLEWKGSLIYGLHTAFQLIANHNTLIKKSKKQFELPISSYRTVLKKTQNLLGDWRNYNSSILYSKYDSLFIEIQHQFQQQNKQSTLLKQLTKGENQFNLKFTNKNNLNQNANESCFNLSFVIANSMTPLPKKLVRGKRFNLRQCQVLIGIQIIKSQLGIIKKIKSIKQLQQNMSCNIKELEQSIQEILPKQQLTQQEIQQLTQKSLIDILKEVPFANNVIDENKTFEPYKRIMYFVKQEILIRQFLQKVLSLSVLQNQNQSLNEKKQKENTNNYNNAIQTLLIQHLKESTKNSCQLLNQPSQQMLKMIQKVQGLFCCYKILGNGWGGNILFICKNKNIGIKLQQTLKKQYYLQQSNKILLGDDLQIYTCLCQKSSNGIMILDPQSQIWY